MEDEKLVINLSKPYHFEGQEYTQVELSNLRELTGKDYREIELMVAGRGQTVFMVEQTINGTNAIATKCTGLPLEFFEGLPMKDALAVRNLVAYFLR